MIRAASFLLLLLLSAGICKSQTAGSYDYAPQQRPWISYYGRYYRNPYFRVPKVPVQYRKNLWRRSNIPGTSYQDRVSDSVRLQQERLELEQRAQIEREWPNRFDLDLPNKANCWDCPLAR